MEVTSWRRVASGGMQEAYSISGIPDVNASADHGEDRMYENHKYWSENLILCSFTDLAMELLYSTVETRFDFTCDLYRPAKDYFLSL